MRRAAIVPVLWLVVATAGCSPSRQAAAPEPRAEARGSTEELMGRTRLPGLAIAEIRDGEIERVDLLGVANAETGELLTEHTLFEAASLSKPVFATAVLRLVERGELDLDRPLGELVDDPRLAHDPRAGTLTARLVLSHQTGLPNWGGERLDFERDPGTGFGYSGEGYVYLQRAVEASTGLPLDELARREVFDPLGMEQSRFSWPEGAELALATPHDEAGAAREKRQQHEGNAAASLHTTAEEYARFVRAWIAGGLLAPETVDMALAPAVRIETERRNDGPEAPRVETSLAWGLGWGIQEPAPGGGGAPIYWHWGDNGPFKAFVALDREGGSGVVYFANGMNGLAPGPALVEGVVGAMAPTFDWLVYERYDAPGFAERLEGSLAESEGRYGEAAAAFRLALVADPEDEVTARRVEWLTDILDRQQRPLDVPEGVLRRYAGSYGPRTLTFEDGDLFYQRGGGQRFLLVPLSETLFVLEGLVIFRLEVEVDARGVPQGLIGHYADGSVDESPRG